MSANRLFLVCQSHPSPEDALCLAERAATGPYEVARVKHADDWFARHARCGAGPDHFALAHARPINWDISMPAPAVASAVRLVLAESDGKETKQ